MTNKHTPGPWHVLEQTSQYHHAFKGLKIKGDDNLIIASTPEVEFKRYTEEYNLNKANAYLIAAAPDMLKALEKFIEAFNREVFDRHDNVKFLRKAKIDAVVAISKVKGKS